MVQTKMKTILLSCCISFIALSLVSCGSNRQASRNEPYLYLEMNVKPLEVARTSFTKQEMSSIKAITEKRIEYLGVSSKTVTIKGQALVVEMYEYTDIEEAKKVLGKPGKFTFTDDQGNIVLTGEHMKKVTYSKRKIDAIGYELPVIELEFDKEGTKILAASTEKNLGKMMNINLDGETLMSPVVHDTIKNGKVILSLDSSTAESLKIVQQITALLKGGTIPAKIIITTAEIR